MSSKKRTTNHKISIQKMKPTNQIEIQIGEGDQNCGFIEDQNCEI
jgi:hypothetical protein